MQIPILKKPDSLIFWDVTNKDLSRLKVYGYDLKFNKNAQSLELINSGKAALFKSGKGEIYVIQIDFLNDNEKSNVSIASKIFTNLGIKIQNDQNKKGE